MRFPNSVNLPRRKPIPRNLPTATCRWLVFWWGREWCESALLYRCRGIWRRRRHNGRRSIRPPVSRGQAPAAYQAPLYLAALDPATCCAHAQLNSAVVTYNYKRLSLTTATRPTPAMFFVPRNLDLWPFNPVINGFPGLNVDWVLSYRTQKLTCQDAQFLTLTPSTMLEVSASPLTNITPYKFHLSPKPVTITFVNLAVSGLTSIRQLVTDTRLMLTEWTHTVWSKVK